MNSLIRLVFTTIIFSLSACQQQDMKQPLQPSSTTNVQTTNTPLQEINPMKNTNELPYQGTVHYIQLEGGFYGIITLQGEKLLPLNMNKQYLKTGTIIQFSGSYVEGMMTIQQWGKPFKINKVKLIKIGKDKTKSEI